MRAKAGEEKRGGKLTPVRGGKRVGLTKVSCPSAPKGKKLELTEKERMGNKR